MTRFTSRLIGIGFVVLAAWFYAGSRPLYQPEGILVPDAPVEELLGSGAPGFEREGWRLTALARYAGEGRVLSVQRYRGSEADLAPVDVALGWGRLSDTAVLRNAEVALGDRRLFYQSFDPTLDERQMVQSIVNLHLVPASPETEARIREVRAGNVVRIAAYVVRAVGPEGRTWEGAAEIPGETAASRLLWVENLEVLPPAPPPGQPDTQPATR